MHAERRGTSPTAATSTATPTAVSKQHSASVDGQAALGAVVRRFDQAFSDGAHDQALQRPFARKIEHRRRPGDALVQERQVFAAAKLASIIAQEDDRERRLT